jgi:hypothetical protein
MSQEEILEALPFEGEGEPITSAKFKNTFGVRGSVSASLRKLIRRGEIKVAMNDDHKQVYVKLEVPKRPPQSVLDDMDANLHHAVRRARKIACKKPITQGSEINIKPS